jgi:hypothetical protein
MIPSRDFYVLNFSEAGIHQCPNEIVALHVLVFQQRLLEYPNLQKLSQFFN